VKQIGITTTVPTEILLAAGYKVVDLNNLFISSNRYSQYIDRAERDGFPKSSCAWIKGIYGVCIENGIQEIIGVVEGDCSNTRALKEVLEIKGIKVYPFAYPQSQRMEDIKSAINTFMGDFNVSLQQVEKTRQRLSKIRDLAKKIDCLTYVDNKVSGFENHLYQIILSDFNGNPEECEKLLKSELSLMDKRSGFSNKLRLGYIGVPPMTCDIYDFIENYNARFVYNEVQREFAFPRADQAKDIYEQYYDYTYPYSIYFRLNEIQKQIKERQLDGIIHYTQSFCYRAIEDIVIKDQIDIPILTIEGDKMNSLDSRTKLRLEAFVDMLLDLKGESV
jgi:benzoyl-CoA reductase/2-hydroxyglutaryl-CoA dehydratase subunit BcrC/BadD/HgdB